MTVNHYEAAMNVALTEDNYPKAEGLLSAALKESAKLYAARSAVRYKMKKLDDSLADASEACNLDSTSAVNYFRKGVALAAKGEFEEAIATFETGNKFDLEDAFNFKMLILGCVADKAHADPDADFKKILCKSDATRPLKIVESDSDDGKFSKILYKTDATRQLWIIKAG